MLNKNKFRRHIYSIGIDAIIARMRQGPGEVESTRKGGAVFTVYSLEC